MKDCQFLKDVIYGRLATGHPALPFKEIWKRDFKFTGIDPGSWELITNNHSSWRNTVPEKREGRSWRIVINKWKTEDKLGSKESTQSRFIWNTCRRDWHAMIELLSISIRRLRYDWSWSSKVIYDFTSAFWIQNKVCAFWIQKPVASF